MTFLRFEPLQEFDNFSDRLQKFFDEFPGHERNHVFNPRVDIYESENSFNIEAEIPGVKKEEINISIKDNILTVSGEKKKVSDEKNEKHFFRSERNYGPFDRSFTLPSEIDRENINAKFENGILFITVNKAKAKEKSERTIEVK